tara:strand:- start:131 stop:685 length:555 start_codon:yes stop_codon:yes gene_type:complete
MERKNVSPLILTMDEKNTKLETWTMPSWASDIITETLQMDLESSAIDVEIRDDLRKAMDSVSMKTIKDPFENINDESSANEIVAAEMAECFGYEPSQLEVLLFRALSRAYGNGIEDEEASHEAYDALTRASYDGRNALTCHIWVDEDAQSEDNPQRVDWEPSGSIFEGVVTEMREKMHDFTNTF